ncbi:NADP-specific glutamate dehydrogenase [Cryptococcus amylolentus CBS 6039]|uniref:Glutamate dehydrogenase n=2 Tax=Cryptococcus amylolentus TaxID=104669 RepID=A0A1E3HK10_9TREE|nr:NADP-specific glutamate dehydrogenase [Cryptococcus amylolentus CBS 6039]ODN76670.1 NADP-specific glutamate dehydrogenase [Cryptococcus amylolentus CBS 6039]ODO04633.1 NADP-specific glutamate dehydrogenase [Cryptococcus amylolentus CBS 6273]
MSNYPQEPEFQQAVNEISQTLEPFLAKNPEYRRALEVAQIPERIVQFRVTYERDDGSVSVNRGYRVQFNSALGPYKGGLRLHPTVNLSILKFLGFEQVFKNALTGLNMGGGKGGSDFDPKGKSDAEIRRFCYAFMQELSRHIGADTDVPAGDIGTGGREIGFMFGAYKKYRNEFAGILTGKGGDWGGSFIRPEATGYGLVYYVTEMLRDLDNTDWKGKRVLLSGAGNVAQYAALKVIELGGTVLSLSDSTGALVATGDEGFTPEDIFAIADIKLQRKSLTAFSAGNKFAWHEGARPWTLVSKADVALPSASQNELNGEEAKALIKAGVRYVAEGSNMGCTLDAIEVFEASRTAAKSATDSGIAFYAPGKAANCGGVAVSGLEMAQNSQRLKWTPEEVDAKLKDIMVTCYKTCWETGKEYAEAGPVPSLVAGANIAGFIKVADAMKVQGDWW